jgi:hypothetical protein
MSGTTVTYDNATYATQSYVTTAVANLVNSAPSTLDTLNELATALGNDANFATTITTSIGTKQPQLNGTGFVKISGTTISYDNSTYYLSSNPNSYITLASLSVTAPLTYNNTTGALNINQASSTVNGWLSYTDWVTFNGKLALTGGTLTGNLSFSQPVGLLFANGQYIKDNGSGGLIIYSGAAVNITATSLTLNSSATFSGAVSFVSSSSIPSVGFANNADGLLLMAGATNGVRINNAANSLELFKITNAGAASFSGNAISLTGANPSITLTGSASHLYSYIALNAGTASNVIYTMAETYNQFGPYKQSALVLIGATSAGISIASTDTNGGVRLYTGGNTIRAEIDQYGYFYTYNSTAQNDLWTVVQTGSTSGLSSFNFDVGVGNEGGGGNIFKVEAAFAHYSGMGYNCLAEFYISTRQTGWETTDVVRRDTALGGSFTASKPNDSTLRVTKNAGSYPGGGKYWIRVTKVTY